MKHRTKIVSVLLTFIMVIAIMPFAQMAKVDMPSMAVTAKAKDVFTSGYCGDTSDGQDGMNMWWSLDENGNLSINGSGIMTDDSPWVSDLRIKHVTIEQGITNIGSGAFAHCSNLVDIDIPSSVSDIGGGAFNDCICLETIELPEGIDTIKNYTFYNCKALKAIDISNITSIERDAFASSGLTSIVIPEGVTGIDIEVFQGCSDLQSVVFSDSVASVGINAFASCSLKSITWGSGLKTIGYQAFYLDDSVEELTIPDSVETLGDRSFTGKFRTVHIGSGLKDFVATSFISYVASSNTDLLENIDISPENPYIHSFDGIVYNSDYSKIVWFYSRRSGTLTFPKEMRAFAFAAPQNWDNTPQITKFSETNISYFEIEEDNPYFKTVDGLLYSKDGTHLVRIPPNCANRDIVIEDSVTTIDEYSAFICRIRSISFPSSLKTIKKFAFCKCIAANNSTFSLSEGLETIEDGAFNSSQIPSIVFPDSLTSLSYYAFVNLNTNKVHLGAGITSIGQNDFGRAEFTVSENNTAFAADDGVLYTKGLRKLLIVPKNKTELTLPSQTTAISSYSQLYGLSTVIVPDDNNAFFSTGDMLFNKNKRILYWVERLTKTDVIVPDTVTVIDNSVFNQNGIVQTVHLPDKLTKLPSFYKCSRLSSINIPFGIKTIEQQTFYQCGNLKELTIPESLETIREDSFMRSGLLSLSLPESVKYCSFSQDHSLNAITVYNKYCVLGRINLFAAGKTVTGYCGSTAHHMAVKRLANFISLGHTYLDWYVYQPATYEIDGIERRDCAYCDHYEERVIPRLQRETYTATFVADGRTVAQIDFQKDAASIVEPAVPAKDRYTGAWEPYTLGESDITVNAVYTLIKSDDATDIVPQSSADLYYETDDVLFKMSASSAAKTIKSVVSQSVPLDIVLVVDQSGSMDETLGGSVKKVDALKSAAHDFVDAVAANAVLTGADHRISVVGFGLAGKYSGYLDNENTELLTSSRGVVPFAEIVPADYSSSLISISDKTTIDAAIDGIEARGATAADLGLEMAKGVFSNADSTGRDRIVVFMTDGAPTYQSNFQTAVANSAIANAKLLKTTYGALVYSVGIFSEADARNSSINNFMQAVSSNYPSAKSLNSLGTEEADSFFTTVNDTDALTGVFHTITTESLSHTASFDNVTLIKTLSKYVTLTAPQEQDLRIDTIRKYGITNDQITVIRNDDGTTVIKVEGLTPYEIEKDGEILYEVSLEFFASLNENATAATEYTVDDEDSGIMLGDAIGYEATFDTSSITLSANKTRYLFTINGELYEIAEGSSVTAVTPDPEFPSDWQFSGWNTSGVVSSNGVIVDATLVKAPRSVTWHTADGDIVQYYTEGEFLIVPEVADKADGSKFLSWNRSLPTVMPDQDLEFTAVYGEHIHRYASEIELAATCIADGVMRFTCTCGDTYTEDIEATGHDFEAITPSTEQDASRCTFVCKNCGQRYEYALDYEIRETSNRGRTIKYEFELTDDDLNKGFEPDGSVVITIPLSEFQNNAKNARVTRTVAGRTENVPFVIEDGFLIITADHFTPYNIDFVFECMETGEHEWEEGTLLRPATCCEQGQKSFTCALCGESKTEDTGYAAHTMTFIPEKDATTEEDGNVAHYHCSVCGKDFEDPLGENEIADVTIEKLPPETPDDPQQSNCACGQYHTGPFAAIIKFFHSIIWFFKNLFT